MHHPIIVGVLNVTPDSYHDGGKHNDLAKAVDRARQMLAEGADIIEVGGESTGPNSHEVGEAEELRRVVPVLTAIRKELPAAKLSVDTYRSATAREAIALGAVMINDVTAGRADPALLRVVAESHAMLVLMFSKDPTPRTTVAMTGYDDVVASIKGFLAAHKALAEAAGVPASRIVLDPGMGHFVSSDARWSLELIARLRELQSLGCPIFVSPSRKSFLAGSENLKTADRLPGTIAASAIAVLHGAAYIRTHDVAEVRRGCEVAAAVRNMQLATDNLQENGGNTMKM